MSRINQGLPAIRTRYELKTFMADVHRISQSGDPNAKYQARDLMKEMVKSAKNMHKVVNY